MLIVVGLVHTSDNNDRYIPVPAPQSEGAKGNGKAAYGVMYQTYSKPPTPMKHGMRRTLPLTSSLVLYIVWFSLEIR